MVIVLLTAWLAAVIGIMLSPWGRRIWAEILLGLRASLIETPLRAITGRKRMTAADYARLQEMEIELGWREPPKGSKVSGLSFTASPLMPYGVTMEEFGRNLTAFGAAAARGYIQELAREKQR